MDTRSVWSMFKIFKVVVELSERFARSANEGVTKELDALRDCAERYKVALQKRDKSALIQVHEEYIAHFVEFRDRFLKVLKSEHDRSLFQHHARVERYERLLRDDLIKVRALNTKGKLKIPIKLERDLSYSLDVLIGSLRGISDALKNRRRSRPSNRAGTHRRLTAPK